MKSILSKILITTLVLSFGLGSGSFARIEAATDSAPQSSPVTTPMAVTTQPLAAPSIVLAQPVSCATPLSVTNNLIQTTGGINLNQLADCFSISLADVQPMPELAIAQPMPLPELSVSSGPAWSSDNMTQATSQQSPPAIMISLALAILIFGTGKVVKKTVSKVSRTINFPTILTLSELQVYRC